MTFLNCYTVALCGDNGILCKLDMIACEFTPNLERLLLRLLLFTADVRNYISNHLRPVLKCLAGTGDCLICAYGDLLDTVLKERCKSRNVALDRAVRLNSDESSLCAKSLSLSVDELDVVAVNLRDDHRNILCPSVC